MVGWILGAVFVAAVSALTQSFDAGARFIEGGASTQVPQMAGDDEAGDDAIATAMAAARAEALFAEKTRNQTVEFSRLAKPVAAIRWRPRSI